jgi:hypothetical protein
VSVHASMCVDLMCYDLCMRMCGMCLLAFRMPGRQCLHSTSGLVSDLACLFFSCRLFKGITPLWGRQIPYTMMKFGEPPPSLTLLWLRTPCWAFLI